MPPVPVDALLSLEDGAVVCGCESGEGGDAPAGVHRLQFILALVLPLHVIYPEADLRGGRQRSQAGLGGTPHTNFIHFTQIKEHKKNNYLMWREN